MAKDFKIKTIFTGIDGLSKTNKAIAKNFNIVTRAALGTNRAIKAIANSSKRMGQNLRSASFGAIIGLTAALTPIVAFSDQINELEAVSRASTQQMSAMTDQAKKLGSTTRFSATQAASAQTFLARAGFKTNEILAATPDVLNLAAASNMDLARTADIASNIMGAFGLEATQMTDVADVLAATTSSANVDLEQLAESLKFAAPIAKEAGLNLRETAAAVGLLGNIGIQGTSAGTALRQMLARLAAPTTAASKLLSQLGIKTKDSTGNLRKLPNILADIAKGMKDLPSGSRIEAINELFGLRGISAGAELISQASLGNLEKLANSFLNVEGRAQSMAETMNKGPGGAIRRLKSAAEGLALSIGDSGLTKQFTKIVKSLTDFTSQLSNSDAATLANIAIMLGLLAVLSPIFLAIGAIVGIIAPLVAGLVFLAGVIGAIMIPLIKRLILQFIILAVFNPFLLIIIAVIAVIAIFAVLIFAWDEAVTFFKSGIDKITKFFEPLTNLVSGIVGSIGKIGALFGRTVLGIGAEDATITTETGEDQSIPAQLAANQASAQASARASVEFVGTPDNVIVSGANGEELDPELGLTAVAGL